jgi:tryptophan halogenase
MIEPIHDIVIVGGGTAGWMTAAALSKVMGETYAIRLVESDEIGIVGVGEATIPMIKLYNNALGIDEADFMRRTKGSFKLGIEFVDWGRVGDNYIHGFGKIGQDLGLVPFHQYWLKQHALGRAAPLEDYSINTAACRANKFMPPATDRPNSPLADIAYAYHFDGGL